MKHELKFPNPLFSDLLTEQPTQISFMDDDFHHFEKGDTIKFKETEPYATLTGREITKEIIYILRGVRSGIPKGHYIIGVKNHTTHEN